MPNKLASQIMKALEEVVSPLMAKSALITQCNSLGLSLDTVGTKDLDEVCKRLQTVLSAFGFEIGGIIPKIKLLT